MKFNMVTKSKSFSNPEFGCKPEESMMVGDRLDNDIHPAKAMGMKTVWIRHGLAQHQNPSPQRMPWHTSLQYFLYLLSWHLR